MNMSGTLPDVFAALPDLQSIILSDNPVSIPADTHIALCTSCCLLLGVIMSPPNVINQVS